eukprot:TRINITY_DN1905_c0_g1_i8.p1 TRINITY_DN1905_c0_g1~~TRINITY_DN1905_c0_g1_i8.p1  ORF type:complete len:933 (-),score=157.50 TRINITY_DN1905_c0_g1_i8:72-2870(-)
MTVGISGPAWPTCVNPKNDRLSVCLERVTDAEKSLNQHLASIKSVLAETREMLTELRTAGPPANMTSQQIVETNADNQPLALREIQGRSGGTANADGVLAAQRAALEQSAADIAASLGITIEDVMKAYDLFIKADADASGQLAIHELKPTLEALSDAVIPEQDFGRILQQFDKNDDGYLNFEEFLFCYCHTPQKQLRHLEERVYKKEHRLPSDVRAKVVGVRTSSIRSYLTSELVQMQACLALPAVLVLFLAFMFSMELHQGNSVIQGMEHAFKTDIEENANFAFSGVVPFENGRMGHKNIYDVNTFADFWSWFDMGLVSLLFPESWDVSEPRVNTAALCTAPVEALLGTGWTFNASVLSLVGNTSFDLGPLCDDLGADPDYPEDFFRKPPYLFFNSIVAGLRLSQEQVPLEECQGADLHLRAYDSKCLQDPGYWIEPDLDEALGMTKSRLNKPNASTHYFLSQWTQAEVRKQAKALENNAWLNQRTGKVEILFTTYNAHQHIFTALYVYFFVNRGGHIHKFIKPMSVWVDPYQSVWSYVVDSVFALMVLKLFFEEARELLMGCYKRGSRTGLVLYFSSFKNLVDWLSILYSLLLFWMWSQHMLVLRELKTSLEAGSTEVQGTWADPADRRSHFELADKVSASSQEFQTAAGFYPLAVGARFISAFSGQPRLALVTDTLFRAAVDIIHFGVVIGCMLLTYTVSAQLLFGREVHGFEDFGRTLFTVFRGLLGDIDYEAMSRAGRPAAGVWFVTFMVLLNLLMLNMLLAIVLDVYSSVKGALSDDAETFWSQANEVFRRWRGLRMRTRISLEEVLIPLEKSCAEYVTASSLMRLVPNLKGPQAVRILKASDEIVADDEVVQEDLSEQIRVMSLRVQHIQMCLKKEGVSSVNVMTMPENTGLRLTQSHAAEQFLSAENTGSRLTQSHAGEQFLSV